MMQSEAGIEERPDRRQAIIVRAIRLLAAVALGVSAYLAWQSITGRVPTGCGPGSGCEEVLASRWSSWMGVPVGVLGAVVYFAILMATAGLGPKNPPARRRLGWVMLTPLAVIAAGAAVWFMVVQVSMVGRFCKYCMVVHACGIAIGGLTVAGLAALPGRRRDEDYRVVPGVRPARVWVLILVGVVGVGVLVAGQILGTPPAPRVAVVVGGSTGGANGSGATSRNVITATSPATNTARSAATATARPIPQFPMGGERVALDPREWPVLGSPDAPAVVAVMGDYTCPHCRVFHGMLEKTLARYPGQLALIVLPVPLNSDCNPRIKFTDPRHANACVLARLALAVWRADPGAFGKMDRWLFDVSTRSRTPGEAREFAVSLVGEAALRRAEADPIVDERIRQAVGFYDRLGGGEIPKLLPPKTTATLRLQTEEDLYRWLEAELGIRPGAGK